MANQSVEIKVDADPIRDRFPDEGVNVHRFRAARSGRYVIEVRSRFIGVMTQVEREDPRVILHEYALGSPPPMMLDPAIYLVEVKSWRGNSLPYSLSVRFEA
ncbi:MAG: hypothetical protein IPK83_08095 [Planctomycetes bacterium]|nr:hypothetical protein [Planctomycetota bacterium]